VTIFAEIGAIRIGIAVLSFVAMVSFGIASFSVWWAMVEKVNARLPDDQRFAFSWWYFPKTQRFYSEYRRLFPSGDLLRRCQRLQVMMMAAATGIVWALRFPTSAIVWFAVVGCASVWVASR